MKKSQLKAIIKEEIKKLNESPLSIAHPTQGNKEIDLINSSELDTLSNQFYHYLSDNGYLSNKCSKKYCDGLAKLFNEFGERVLNITKRNLYKDKDLYPSHRDWDVNENKDLKW